jgi:hypothetical protein
MFKVYFAVYQYNYKFFINIFLDHLISISKWEFFWKFYSLGFELVTLFQILFAKNSFNINLVEIQIHAISRSSICDNNL